MYLYTCSICQNKCEFVCKFNNYHTHSNYENTYCMTCNKCDIKDKYYKDYCKTCNGQLITDYNNIFCDSCLDTTNKIINCKICNCSHPKKYNCEQCNTCNFLDKNSHIYHCTIHNMCHNYKIGPNIFRTCTHCKECFNKNESDDINELACKDCYYKLNHPNYCKLCTKIHSQHLDNYNHCIKCNKCYKSWNIFQKIIHYDCDRNIINNPYRHNNIIPLNLILLLNI